MKQRGFTLIELLVVIVIMATLIGTATLGFGRGESQRFMSESQQMQAWLGQLQTEAILTSTTWAARFKEHEAEALVWGGASWLKPSDIENYQLPENITISHALELTAEEAPHIMVLPTGQIMPPGAITLSTEEAAVALSWHSGSIDLVVTQ